MSTRNFTYAEEPTATTGDAGDDWLSRELTLVDPDEVPAHLRRTQKGGHKTAGKPTKQKPRKSASKMRRAEKLEQQLTEKDPDQFFRTFATQVMTGQTDTPMFPPLWLDEKLIAPIRKRLTEVYNDTRLSKTIAHKPPHRKARRSHKALHDNVHTLVTLSAKALLETATSYRRADADMQTAQKAQQQSLALFSAALTGIDKRIKAAGALDELPDLLQQLNHYHAKTAHPNTDSPDVAAQVGLAAMRYESMVKVMAEIADIVTSGCSSLAGARNDGTAMTAGAQKYLGYDNEIKQLTATTLRLETGMDNICHDLTARLEQHEVVYARANISWLKENAHHALESALGAVSSKHPIGETAESFARMFPGLHETDALASALDHHSPDSGKGSGPSIRARLFMGSVITAGVAGGALYFLGGVDGAIEKVWKATQWVMDGPCPEDQNHLVTLHDDVLQFEDLASSRFPKTVVCYQDSHFDAKTQVLARDLEGDELVDVIFVDGPYMGQKVTAPFEEYLEKGALGLLQADEEETEEPAPEAEVQQDAVISKPVAPLSPQAQEELNEQAIREYGQPMQSYDEVAPPPVEEAQQARAPKRLRLEDGAGLSVGTGGPVAPGLAPAEPAAPAAVNPTQAEVTLPTRTNPPVEDDTKGPIMLAPGTVY